MNDGKGVEDEDTEERQVVGVDTGKAWFLLSDMGVLDWTWCNLISDR